MRLADARSAGKTPFPGSTALQPRVTLANDTRVVLDADGTSPPSGSERLHATVTLAVESGARMDFAYACQATTGGARFRVTVRSSDAKTSELLDASIPSCDAAGPAWHDASVPFPEPGRFEVAFLSSSAGPGAVRAFFSAPVLTAPSTHTRPSILLVSLDTLRAKSLSVYGYERRTSPQMERLFGQEGMVVERVYAPFAATFGAHVGMLFGVSPSAVTESRAGRALVLPVTPSLAEVLSARGYRTAAFTEDAVLDGPAGFMRGFEVYVEEKRFHGPWREADPSEQAVPGYIAQVFDAGLAWLLRHRGEPTFLFLHTYQVHSPYDPPEAYRELFPSQAAGPAARDRDDYDREIAYTDAQIGRLMARLEEAGLAASTIVVVTGDHGEEFGEHGRAQHGTQLYDETIRVPLLLRAPGLLPAGTRCQGPAALIDLMPTLLELVGVEAPATVQGRSIARHLTTGTPVAPRLIWSEARSRLALGYEGIDASWIPPSFSVIQWPRKLVRIRTPSGVRYELYDLDRDPGETVNLYEAARADVDALRSKLDSYEDDARRTQAGLLAHAGPIDPGWRPAAREADRASKLRALGYVE
jgi:arylsulfatase A-like enzyme